MLASHSFFSFPLSGVHILLHPDGEGNQNRGDHDDLHSHLLSDIHFWLSSPVQELDDILGHLRGGGWGSILILNQSIEEDTSHSNSGTWEVWVEVETLWDGD